MFSDPGRNDLIEVKGRVFAAPGIVIPIDNGQLRITIAFDKDRAVIAAPRFVGRDVQILNVTRIVILQQQADLLFVSSDRSR